MTVHPSSKLLIPWYAVAALLAFGILWYNHNLTPPEPLKYWLFIIPAFIIGAALMAHSRRIFTRLRLQDYRLCYEAGFLVRTTRTMELRNVQDVRVEQNLFQRMLNTGNISIETAGESSGIMMVNIDRPHFFADAILTASREHSTQDRSSDAPAPGKA